FSRDWSSDVCSSDLSPRESLHDRRRIHRQCSSVALYRRASMTVTILYFAGLRELLGVGEERVDLTADVSTVEQLAEELVKRHPRSEERRVGKEWRTR